MSIPINYQREKIKKYFNLLVENFITDPRHKDYSIVFENDLGSSENFRNLGRTQRRGGGSETTWKTINGVKVAGSERTTYFPYKYVISFLNNYENEDELRGAVVHEFTHHYLYSTIEGKHDHDDRFYSTMEWLESWFDKNQGLSPRLDKSHDRDQYVGDNSSDTKDEENTCPECSFLSPQHSPQCSHNQSNPRPTENTIDPQKAAEFDSLRKLLKNSKDLATLEKNYQTVKGNSLYSNETSQQNNKDDYNNKSRLDNLYQAQKWLLQSQSNDQLTNNSKSSLKENRSGVGSAFWLCLAGGGIILVGIIGYLVASSKPSYKPNRKKR